MDKLLETTETEDPLGYLEVPSRARVRITYDRHAEIITTMPAVPHKGDWIETGRHLLEVVRVIFHLGTFDGPEITIECVHVRSQDYLPTPT